MAENDELLPRLRPDLTWEEIADGETTGHRLIDTRFGRRLKVDDRGRAIAELLDRKQTSGELLRRIQETTGRPMKASALDRVVASFDGLGLLESGNLSQAWARAPAKADPEGDESAEVVPLLIPPELRFTCTSCGSCCVGVNVGPVTEDVVLGLEERSSELKQADDKDRGFFYKMVPEGEDEEIRVCQTRNGACTFLQGDGLCRVHRKLGSSAKPYVCRLFPFRFVLTPGGIQVGLQMECREIMTAARGQKVADQEESLRELVRLVPALPAVRPFVSLDGETAVTFEEYESIEKTIVEAVRSAGGGFKAIVAGFEVLAERCRASTQGDVNEPTDPAQLKMEFYRFVSGIGETLVKLKQKYMEAGNEIRFHTENLDRVVEALADLPIYAGTVFDDENGEAARFALLATENFWSSKEEALAPSEVMSAAARHGFHWFLTRTLAVFRARQVHRRFPTDRDLVDAWVVTHMLVRNKRVREALSGMKDQTVSLFGHRLRDLVNFRRDLETTDPMTDFFLF